MRIRADFCVPITLVLILLAGCGGSGSSESVTSAFDLSVSLDGPGTGTVSSQPAGIDCGTDCSESYAANALVTLSASRAAGSVFDGWSGACSGTDSCTVVMDAARSVTATFGEFAVDCSAYPTYSPPAEPEILPSDLNPLRATIIVMHGKTGSPLDIYLQPLISELSDNGYDVVAPYMPWSGLDWGASDSNGSMCGAMNYIDSLVAQQSNSGIDVIIAGHSMGGAHALIYSMTNPPDAVKGIVALAPGHFPHLEESLQSLIASSIADAEDMVATGTGDSTDTFLTLLPNPSGTFTQTISATANNYLSYHAVDKYPDIRDVLPPIKLPVLWLAGEGDPLTDFYNMPALADQISSAPSAYVQVSGNHLDMVANTPGPIENWLDLLGL